MQPVIEPTHAELITEPDEETLRIMADIETEIDAGKESVRKDVEETIEAIADGD